MSPPSLSSSSSSPWGATQNSAPTIDTVSQLLNSSHPNSPQNIVVLAGAGISTSSGIPDFRSPETGLYANLEKYNLPFPEAIFDINYFREKPEAFFALSKELYPGTFRPTLTHTFFRLLYEKKKLLRVFTQNIDTLERLAGLPADKIVEAHGSFATARCIRCSTPVDDTWMRLQCMSGTVARCQEARCITRGGNGQGGLVKPDIVFFGEGLPSRFFELISDLKKADLLIVVGTSLQVQPFASLVDRVRPDCPRLLINLERVGEIASYGGTSKGGLDRLFGGGMRGLMNESGFDFEGWTLGKGKGKEHIRDVFYQGKTDEGVRRLAKGAEWQEELERLHKMVYQRLDADEKRTMSSLVDAAGGASGEVDPSHLAPSSSKGTDEEKVGAKAKADEVAEKVAGEAKKDKESEDLATRLGALDVKEEKDNRQEDGQKKGPSL